MVGINFMLLNRRGTSNPHGTSNPLLLSAKLTILLLLTALIGLPSSLHAQSSLRAAKPAPNSLQCVGLHLFATTVTLPVLTFPVMVDLHNSSSTPLLLHSAGLAFFTPEIGASGRRDVTQQIDSEPDAKNPQTVLPLQTVHLKFQLQLFQDAPTGRIEVEPRVTWLPQAATNTTGVAEETPPTVSQIKLYVNGTLQGTTPFRTAWKAMGHSQIGRGLFAGKPVDFFHGRIADARAYRRALTSAEIQALYSEGPSTHWQFDRSDSDPNAAGNQGTFVGGAQILPGETSLSLSGQGAYVDMHAAVVDTNHSYSVSAWVRFSDVTGYQSVISQDGAQLSGFYLQIRGDDNLLAFAVVASDAVGTPAIKAESTFQPRPDHLYYLVGVYQSITDIATPAVTPLSANGQGAGSVQTMAPGVPVVLTITAATGNAAPK